MTGFRVYAIVLLASPLVASLCGCAKKEDKSRPEGQTYSASGGELSAASTRGTQNGSGSPRAHDEGILLSGVLASWESGKKEDAVKQLLSIPWDQPAVFANMPIMNLSEKNFGSLPHDERIRTSHEIHEVVGTLKALARHAISVGENAQASGDKQTAIAHYEAVVHLGEALSSPQHVLVIQQSGKGIANGAQERLSAVK